MLVVCCHHNLIHSVSIFLANVEWERYKMIYMYIEALKTKGTNESAKFKNGKQTRKANLSTNYMHCLAAVLDFGSFRTCPEIAKVKHSKQTEKKT